MPPWRRLASTCAQPAPPLASRRHDHRSRPVPRPAGHHGSGSQVRQPLRRGTLIRTVQPAVARLAIPPRHAFRIT